MAHWRPGPSCQPVCVWGGLGSRHSVENSCGKWRSTVPRAAVGVQEWARGLRPAISAEDESDGGGSGMTGARPLPWTCILTTPEVSQPQLPEAGPTWKGWGSWGPDSVLGRRETHCLYLEYLCPVALQCFEGVPLFLLFLNF